MKLVNDTKWSSESIKKILDVTLKQAGWQEKSTELVVHINSSRVSLDRSPDVTGYAYFGRVSWHSGKKFEQFGLHYHIRIGIPTAERLKPFQNERCKYTIGRISAEVAQVFIHEMDHSFKSMRHHEMACSNTHDVSFIGELCLEEASGATPEQANQEKNKKANQRILELKSRIKRLETKRKFVETYLKKAKRQLERETKKSKQLVG